jgi:tetratricopeptide (TPR) repeat protein
MVRFEHLEIGPDPADPNAGEPSRPGQARPDASRCSAAPRPGVLDERQAYKVADQHRRRGQYENALRFYSRALESDKSLVAGWVGQIQMLVQMDEAPEAELWSRKALELFPGNGELLAAQTQALCRLGDVKRAGASCDGALAAQGTSAFRWIARGEWMLATRQKMDDHCFTKAREVDADWIVPLESALVYLHYRFPARAVRCARLATELAPAEYYAWFVRGCAEQDAAMGNLALQCFRTCLQICPGHVEAKQRLERRKSGWSLGPLFRTLLLRR